MLSTYLIVDAITVALLLTLAGLALAGRGYKSRLNRLLAGFAFALTVWLPSNHIGNSLSVPHDIAVFFNYLVFAFSFIAGILLVKIVILIADLPRERRIIRVAEWVLWPFAVISATPLVGKSIERQESINGVVFGPLGDVYGILLVILVAFMVYVIIRGLKVQTGLPKRQLKSVSLAFILVIPLVLILSYILPAVTGIFAFTEFGVTPMVLLVVALYYSVVRHQLFDIRLAAVRTVGYTLTLAAMAGIYMLLAYAVSILFFSGTVTEGVGLSPANIAIALALALLFQPIKLFFDKLTNKVFYRGQYSQSTFLREFGKIISHDTDLFLLLKQASACVGKTLSAEKVFFYVNDRGIQGRYNAETAHISGDDVTSIARFFNDNKGTDEVLMSAIANESTQQLLGKHRLQLAVRLIVGNQVLGYLFIGEHKGRGYSPRDIRTLGMVANELAIAMQNALSVEEVRDLNNTLKQRIDNATRDLRNSNRQLQELDKTKDEFISMASHQLRTPLTSIKGYLDMVLDGDMGEVNDTQRTALTEAYMSSERMVSLINDFLNVSRLQTGKFNIDKHDVDLGGLVKEQAQMLSIMASQHDIEISINVDSDIPVVMADSGKIQQVLLNMMDNAIYYSKPGTKVQVTLAKKHDQVVFRVKDTGIGVPEAEQDGLFGKFFRASNARKRRPDGTGVGLFLAKKVVTGHGGEIIFESTEGEGSTFGFSLPLR